MKIVLDCYQYQPFVTGTDRQAYHFIKHLQNIDSHNQYVILCSRENYIPSIVKNSNFKVLRPWDVSFLPNIIVRVFNKFWRTGYLQYLRLSPADVYCSFHNMVLPNFRVAKKMIMSNLDLIPIVLPDYFNVGRYNKKQNIKRYRKSLEHADSIISISNYSKNELVNFFNINPKIITVIPLAADLPDSTIQIEEISNIKLPKKYIITTGGSEIRKNVETVISAHSMLSGKLQKEYPLLITGGNWHDRQLNYGDSCIDLGRVTDIEQSYLFSKCSLYISASFYEGFGLPIVEAADKGAPVICSRGTSHDEICSEKIPQFDPHNASQLSKMITNFLEDHTKLADLSKDCRTISAKYTWTKSTKLLYELFVN